MRACLHWDNGRRLPAVKFKTAPLGMQFPPSTLRLFSGWCRGLLNPSAKSPMPSCFTSAAINCAGLVPFLTSSRILFMAKHFLHFSIAQDGSVTKDICAVLRANAQPHADVHSAMGMLQSAFVIRWRGVLRCFRPASGRFDPERGCFLPDLSLFTSSTTVSTCFIFNHGPHNDPFLLSFVVLAR